MPWHDRKVRKRASERVRGTHDAVLPCGWQRFDRVVLCVYVAKHDGMAVRHGVRSEVYRAGQAC